MVVCVSRHIPLGLHVRKIRSLKSHINLRIRCAKLPLIRAVLSPKLRASSQYRQYDPLNRRLDPRSKYLSETDVQNGPFGSTPTGSTRGAPTSMIASASNWGRTPDPRDRRRPRRGDSVRDRVVGTHLTHQRRQKITCGSERWDQSVRLSLPVVTNRMHCP